MTLGATTAMEDPVRLPSERSFGLLFAAISAAFAGWAWHAGRDVARGGRGAEADRAR